MNNKQIIKLLKSIHTKNNSLPILDNILIDKDTIKITNLNDVSINNTMKIYANDLDNEIEYTTYIDFIYQKLDEKDYSPEFKIALNPKQLINILNECNGVIRLELNSFNKIIKIDDNFFIMPLHSIN
jgi:DNA polymerase III sliding clamp (beta) subunit (PCNA family)